MKRICKIIMTMLTITILPCHPLCWLIVQKISHPCMLCHHPELECFKNWDCWVQLLEAVPLQWAECHCIWYQNLWDDRGKWWWLASKMISTNLLVGKHQGWWRQRTTQNIIGRHVMSTIMIPRMATMFWMDYSAQMNWIMTLPGLMTMTNSSLVFKKYESKQYSDWGRAN